MLPSDTANSPPSRKRGRPAGTFKHSKDQGLIAQAARFINTGHASSARQAFSMLTDDDDTAIRRLQRRWEKVGEDALRMDRITHRERCEHEYRSLRESIPALWARIETFVGSPKGRRFLKENKREDGEPTHPMALGIAVLMEAVEAYEQKLPALEAKEAKLSYERRPAKDPTDNSQANQMRFDRALDGWFTGGLPVTPAALRVLAERVNKLADALEADLTRGKV